MSDRKVYRSYKRGGTFDFPYLPEEGEERELSIPLSIPLNNTEAIDLLQEIETSGLNQINSKSMVKLIKSLAPDEYTRKAIEEMDLMDGGMEFVTDFFAALTKRFSKTTGSQPEAALGE